jgi:hypothetical protein
MSVCEKDWIDDQKNNMINEKSFFFSIISSQRLRSVNGNMDDERVTLPSQKNGGFSNSKYIELR